jgi:hypothetical protein
MVLGQTDAIVVGDQNDDAATAKTGSYMGTKNVNDRCGVP